ncbi:aldolase/citrate lyase family protein, partial [Klebsiella pneumoniae]|uniref:aldolase/citrate lyase family protein n=1 Tax=Klebsiella pneumoniae TaxID=573 RepID=UPI0034D3918C
MTDPLAARSLLFAPGDSERKLAKAGASEADLVLLDLEDAVAEGNKPAARAPPSSDARRPARPAPMGADQPARHLARPARPCGDRAR